MHPQEWRDFARERWEKGWKPSRVLDGMEKEFGHRVKYRTLKTWADDGGWKYFEDSDTPRESNPNEPFGVSGITDPIYHMSLVLGKRLIRENSMSGSTTDPKEYGSRPSAIVADALDAVDREYDPGPHTIDYLKPVLTKYVNTIRNAAKASKENRLNEDPKRNIKSQNRLKAIREEVPEIEVVQPEDLRQRVTEILEPESKSDVEVALEVATEMPPEEELERMVNEEPE